MWSAEKITGALAGLHPDFFPTAVEPEPPNKWPHDGIQPLNKASHKRLWVEAGDVLHRGSLQTLDKPRTPDQAGVITRLSQVANLLAKHRIQLIDPGFQLICTMNSQRAGGRVITELVAA